MSRRRTIRLPTSHQRCRSFANQTSIQCQLCANPVPIRCQSIANPMSANSANPSPIRCQSITNPFPIRCQFNINPLPIPDQFRNMIPIHCQSANPISICQSNADLPIQYQSANPMPICQSQKNHGSVVALLPGKFLQKSGKFLR